jgi:hypothetical protein
MVILIPAVPVLKSERFYIIAGTPNNKIRQKN